VSNQHFARLSPHVHWLSPDSTTDRPVLGAVSGTRGTLLVDAGNSPAHAALLLREVAARQLAPPAFLVLTHWHWDHVFGTATIDLPTFAHHRTRQIIMAMTRLDWSDAALDQRVVDGSEIAFCRDMIKAELPDRSQLVLRPPEIGFASTIELDLGGVTCELIHVGGDHAADATVVHVIEDRVVFLADCLSPAIYDGPRRYTTARLFPLLDRLLGLHADAYLAGHDPDPISYALLLADAESLMAVGRAVDQHGPDRAAVRAALATAVNEPLDDSWTELIDAFLAGRCAQR